MKLVELKGANDFSYFVNPEQVTFVCPCLRTDTLKPLKTIIYFANEENYIEIVPPIAEVVQKLTTT